VCSSVTVSPKPPPEKGWGSIRKEPRPFFGMLSPSWGRGGNYTTFLPPPDRAASSEWARCQPLPKDSLPGPSSSCPYSPKYLEEEFSEVRTL
jgi:hypothetical protein